MKILVIDDDATIARAIQRALREHEIVVSTDPATALEQLANATLTEPFDLVLCDARMPTMTGLQVLAALQGFREPPIFVLMSGDDDLIDAETGADAFLIKPFLMADVRAAIARSRDARATASTIRISRIAAA